MRLKKTFEYEGEKYRIIVRTTSAKKANYLGTYHRVDIYRFKLYKEFVFKIPFSIKEIKVFGLVHQDDVRSYDCENKIKQQAQRILLNYVEITDLERQNKKKEKDAVDEFLNWGYEKETEVVDNVI